MAYPTWCSRCSSWTADQLLLLPSPVLVAIFGLVPSTRRFFAGLQLKPPRSIHGSRAPRSCPLEPWLLSGLVLTTLRPDSGSSDSFPALCSQAVSHAKRCAHHVLRPQKIRDPSTHELRYHGDRWFLNPPQLFVTRATSQMCINCHTYKNNDT